LRDRLVEVDRMMQVEKKHTAQDGG